MIFCSLYSGSSGNSIFVASENSKILIDAGLPGKSIDAALKEIGEDPKELDAIFVTHEHSDHIKGIGVMSRKYDIPIYANNKTWLNMSNSIGKIKDHNIKVMDKDVVTIRDMDVINYPIPHDAASPVGYSVHSSGKKVSVATDLGCFTEDIKKNIEDSDVILLESNHDIEMLKFGPYPYNLKRRILSSIGHLSNDDCGSAIVDMMNHKYKRIILGHLSHTNNYPDLAYQTVINVLRENNIELQKDIALTMAHRSRPSSYIKI
ncbi:MBL fold metallo-hydrolase [Clostridium sp. MSJ-4]|uniref:MBL fold metallo-hydrolase n=1 Tax=Clostridium simiarum TaxID=2841506 RepID=A0ABS6F3Y4_9CLOT|nr:MULTISPECIES: MBL fold metallo-hydrolase [Clostridium]MBU5592328.1 MBL fold metallo-hydrolase [Clostridium simiarum]